MHIVALCSKYEMLDNSPIAYAFVCKMHILFATHVFFFLRVTIGIEVIYYTWEFNAHFILHYSRVDTKKPTRERTIRGRETFISGSLLAQNYCYFLEFTNNLWLEICFTFLLAVNSEHSSIVLPVLLTFFLLLVYYKFIKNLFMVEIGVSV